VMHGRCMGSTTDHLTTNYLPTYHSPPYYSSPYCSPPHYFTAHHRTTSLLAAHLPVMHEEGEWHAAQVEGDARRARVIRLREVTQLVAPEAPGRSDN